MKTAASTIARTTPPQSTRPPTVCPEHELEGGPVRYRCPLNHSVPAADISREVTR